MLLIALADLRAIRNEVLDHDALGPEWNQGMNVIDSDLVDGIATKQPAAGLSHPHQRFVGAAMTPAALRCRTSPLITFMLLDRIGPKSMNVIDSKD